MSRLQLNDLFHVRELREADMRNTAGAGLLSTSYWKLVRIPERPPADLPTCVRLSRGRKFCSRRR